MWRTVALAGLALWLTFWFIPADYAALRSLVLYPLADVGALVAILVGVRRYRPRVPRAWLLIAAGVASVTVADLIYGAYEVAGRQPFPSVADVFYLLAYPLYALGLHVAGKVRLPEGDRGAFIDAAIITVTAGLFAFLLIVETYIEDPTIGLVTTIVASAYPLADVLLFAVAVRFVLSVRWRTPALLVLSLGLGLTLAGDVIYSAGELFTSGGDTGFADWVLAGGTIALGLAGLHPSMTELTAEPVEVGPPEYSVPRVVGLYLVSMIPVAVLAVQALTAQARHAWVTIIALVLVSSLVVARFLDLAGQTRRAADREATLSRFSSELLRADGREELFGAAERAAGKLLPDGSARVVERGPDSDHSHDRFTAPVEVDGDVVAEIVADDRLTNLRTVRDALDSVARGLSLALEREALVSAQRAAAENLAAQNAQLRELDRMKDQLVSSVSHELRTPLTSLGGYAELLLDGEAGELNEDQQHFVAVIDRNCRRLNRLIDDILFASRVDAGRLSLERGWVDVAELAAASLETARVRAQQGDLVTELTAPDGLPQVWADPTRLTQMFDNLISNAVKFTPPGGTIRVTLTEAGSSVQIEVADTGMGIPEDEVDRLFERFFRTSTVGAVAGTGLGLSIVKSIVEVHDGTIGVSSVEGVGTTFRIELPVQPRSEAARPEPTEAAG